MFITYFIYSTNIWYDIDFLDMFITYFHKFDASRIERDKWQGSNSTGF